MIDANSLQLRLQGYADCYAETDPEAELKEIHAKGVAGDATGDLTEVALKYLALSILHGIDQGASHVMIEAEGTMNGSCRLAGRREIKLPPPPTGLARRMIDILRCVAGVEKESGTGRIAYGFRNDRFDLHFQVSRDGDREELSIHLPRVAPA